MNLDDLDKTFKRYVLIYRINTGENRLIINKPIPVADFIFIKNYLKFLNKSYDDIIIEQDTKIIGR